MPRGGVCWQGARMGISRTLEAAKEVAGHWEQLKILENYARDDGQLYYFCCNGNHNDYCWGSASSANLLPDEDSLNGFGGAQ